MSGSRLNRREFLESAASTAAVTTAGSSSVVRGDESQARNSEERKEFRVWAMGCSHVGTDLRVGKRKSLAEAIQHSEQGGDKGGPAFSWDIALHLGDLSGNQGSPSDEEGREVIKQFSATRKHRREDFYNIAGNHDASGPDEPSMGWFRKWVDPDGQNSAHSRVNPQKRPYPVVGTWERYSFRVGNMLFLMMSDRNDGGPPIGRGKRGGYPAGAVTAETFEWWQKSISDNPDAVIVSAHHHMLKETTFASGPWEGFQKKANGAYVSHYHGYFPQGGPQGASYLYFVDGKPDAQAFERYLSMNNGAIDLWLGGHTHSHPDDNKGGRTHIEKKWGVNFVNVAALAKHHARKTTVPMSRLFTFTDGSKKVRIQCYLHTSDHAKQGWYKPAERVVELNRPFKMS